MRYFIDTEFIENGATEPIHLLSIGIASEDGRQYYAQNIEAPFEEANDWVKANAYPHLYLFPVPDRDGPMPPWHTRAVIAADIFQFVGDDPTPEFWAYYADYDWVVFCQLFGTMSDLPKGWPMFCRDLRQGLDDYGRFDVCQPDDMPHNAGSDAQWVAATWKKHLAMKST